MLDIHSILSISPVIPVVKINSVDAAVSLAQTYHQAGMNIIEVTLRTEQGLGAVKAIREAVPEMCVGAGTVWTSKAAEQVIDNGAQFIVTPGRTDAVYETCEKRGIPLLPGVQTVSEISHWHSLGLEAVKFFPAEVAGGVAALKAFSSVFEGMKFCPTGGIKPSTAHGYLALKAVPCVGGSWLVDQKALDSGNWEVMEELARDALKLAS